MEVICCEIKRCMNDFLLHPKLIFNFDYMEEFMMLRKDLSKASKDVQEGYEQVYEMIVPIYQRYCDYYLSIDNKDGCSVSQKELCALQINYMNTHLPDPEKLRKVVENVLQIPSLHIL